MIQPNEYETDSCEISNVIPHKNITLSDFLDEMPIETQLFLILQMIIDYEILNNSLKILYGFSKNKENEYFDTHRFTIIRENEIINVKIFTELNSLTFLSDPNCYEIITTKLPDRYILKVIKKHLTTSDLKISP